MADAPRHTPMPVGFLAKAAVLLSGIAAAQGCGLLPPSAADVEVTHWNWPCEALGPIPGPEDIALDQRNGIACVSSTDRLAVEGRAKPVAADGPPGRLYRIDLKADPPKLVDVTPAADGWGFLPQGIDFLDDGTERRLFAGSTIDGLVHSYEWTGESPAQPDGRPPVVVGRHADNLFLMPDGSLRVAVHPSLLRFFLYARGMADTAGTQVLRITPGTDGRQTVREIVADNGTRLSAGSSAVLYEGGDGSRRLLIGAVYTNHLLVCKGDGCGRP